MKLIKVFCLICVFLCAGSLTEAGEVHPDSTGSNVFTVADNLFSSGDYNASSVEYEKAGYFSQEKGVKTEALIRKAECLKQLHLYPEAVRTLSRINYEDLPDSLVYKSRYQSALCSYLAENFANAESQLLQLHFFIPDSMYTRGSLPLYALVLNEMGRWKEAKEKMQKAIRLSTMSSTQKDSLNAAIEVLYNERSFPKAKNETKAQIMDALIPGSGHIYAGYFWEGTASFLFNAATLAFAGYNIYTKFYITTVAASTSVFEMFYMGGMNRVDFLVKKKNYLVKGKFNRKLKDEILKTQAVLK